MPSPSLIALRRPGTSRYRLGVLAWLACLGLLLQPCMTASALGLAACPHHGQQMPDRGDMPCHLASAPDCNSASTLHVDDPPPAALPPAAVAAYPDAPATRMPALAAHVLHDSTDPPVRIRFCSLNN